MPSINELSQLQFLDPSIYLQGLKQVDQSNQAFDQQQALGAADLEAKGLANMYAGQANPLRLEQLGLQNTGMGYENTINKVRAEDAQDPAFRAAQRAEKLKTLDEATLASLKAKGEALSMDPDPEKAQRGKNMFEGTWAEMKRRAAAADALAQTNALIGGRKDVSEINSGARATQAELDRASREKIAGMRSADNRAKMANNVGKPAKNLEEELTRAFSAAATETDPDKRDDLLEYANGVQQLLVNARQASTAQGIDAANVANLPKRGTAPVPMPPVIRAPPMGAPLQANTRPVISPTDQLQRDTDALPSKMAELAGAERDLALARKNGASASDIKELQGLVDGLKREVSRAPAAAKAAAPAGMVAVVNKDGKPGMIPADKLDAALKAGFKQR